MQWPILNAQGQETGRTAELADAVFAVEPHEHAVWLAVRQHLANKRRGTAKTKEKSEVAGSTRKLYRQKGTGNARRGQIRSPLLRGGGTVHGPRPRDYSFKLNRKLKRLARKSVLSSKVADQAIRVLEPVSYERPSTKACLQLLNNLQLNGRKVLFVTPGVEDATTIFYLSARNLPKVSVLPVSELGTYDLIQADVVVLFETALEPLVQQLTEQTFAAEAA